MEYQTQLDKLPLILFVLITAIHSHYLIGVRSINSIGIEIINKYFGRFHFSSMPTDQLKSIIGTNISIQSHK